MTDYPLAGHAVFISASIPDPSRWDGSFRPFEITDAVVAIARAILSHGGRLVTAAHPTIAPLILYVAAELPHAAEPQVAVYQSAVFDNVLPEATRRFEADGVGVVVRTDALNDEPGDPTRAPASLELMRRQLLADEEPIAAVFVGGMGGIPAEHQLFRELRPDQPTYALGQPGGEAQKLVEESPSDVRDLLGTSRVYPSVARAIVQDLVHRIG